MNNQFFTLYLYLILIYNLKMYLLKENSLNTDDPTFQKLKKGCILFPEKIVAKIIASYGYYEKELIHWCKDNFVNKNKVFLDIGAHVGTYSIELADKFKKVYAFECSSRTYNCLCGNIALNNLDEKIKAYNFALGDKNQQKKLFLRCDDGGLNGCVDDEKEESEEQKYDYIIADMRTLDSFNFQDIGFIKIDVEGFELNVLKGAEETLKRNNYPKFMFECWKHDIKHKESLFSYIESLNYKIISLNGNDEMFLAEYKE